MTRLRYFRSFVWLHLLCIGSLSLGQVITVRLVNAKNGRPLSKKPISVYLFHDKDEKRPSQYDAILKLKTDAHGDARFTLPNPAPSHLSVCAHLRSDAWRCMCTARIVTQDVVQKGVVKGQDLAGAGPPQRAAPGQLLFVVRHRPFFEQLIYKLLAPLMV